jgi:hypothetical protein
LFGRKPNEILAQSVPYSAMERIRWQHLSFLVFSIMSFYQFHAHTRSNPLYAIQTKQNKIEQLEKRDHGWTGHNLSTSNKNHSSKKFIQVWFMWIEKCLNYCLSTLQVLTDNFENYQPSYQRGSKVF